MFQVGHLIDLEDDDPIFESLEKAVTYTLKTFEYADWPVGIWRKEDGELIFIFYQGELFTK